MALSEFLHRSIELYRDSLLESLDGLSETELAFQPDPASMSIGFITWHTARVHDMLIHTAAQELPQLWVSDGWADRLGRAPADPQDLGFGFGPEELAAFTVPDPAALTDYLDAAHAAALQHIATQDDDTLTTTWVPSPVGGRFTLADIYQQLIWEMNQHGGQVAYLRGLQRGIEDPYKLSPIWLDAQARS